MHSMYSHDDFSFTTRFGLVDSMLARTIAILILITTKLDACCFEVYVKNIVPTGDVYKKKRHRGGVHRSKRSKIGIWTREGDISRIIEHFLGIFYFCLVNKPACVIFLPVSSLDALPHAWVDDLVRCLKVILLGQGYDTGKNNQNNAKTTLIVVEILKFGWFLLLKRKDWFFCLCNIL